MPLRRTFRVEKPCQLLDYLVETSDGARRATLKNYLKHRCVSVNGQKAVRHDHPLAPGDVVQIELDKKTRPGVTLDSGIRILYEDGDVIVIHKPTGLIAVPSEEARHGTAYNEVSAYLHSQHPGWRCRLHVVHRIDKPTSGILLFAKSSQARAWFLDNWKRVDKRYLAVVEGAPDPPAGTVRSHLTDNDETMHVSSGPQTAESRLAITHYSTLRTHGPYALVECQIETGRKNQIRVQMAEIGHPVVGDVKYGKGRGPCARLALHAWRIAFPHPRDGRRIEVESEFPRMLERLLEDSP